MKFIKGVIVGSMLCTGAVIMYKEGMLNKKKAFKSGKKLVKKLGIM